jgi:hypothetical protein
VDAAALACALASTAPTDSSQCNFFTYPLVPSDSCLGDGSAGSVATFTREQCVTLCAYPGWVSSCQVVTSDAGPALNCLVGCDGGRRAPEVEPVVIESVRSVEAYFAASAALEAESITAFRVLASELRVHGAPRRLRARALRSAREEVRHTRAMRAWAARSGGSGSTRVPRRTTAVRSLEAIACDNASEGCVRETFGAAVAQLQSERARDAALRATMAEIAGDETRHAAFSWDLARWIDSRLDDAARERVQAARDAAVRELRALIDRLADDDAVARELGRPGKPQALALFEALRRSLWSSATAR